MKAFRNLNGNIIEIEIDIGIDGKPILPPDTTIDEKPDASEGHYVTVVGNKWVQIPIPVSFTSFETKKQQACDNLKVYRDWLFVQPIEHNGILFDADEKARARLSEALVMFRIAEKLPPAWITYDNSVYPITESADLVNLSNTIYDGFSQRFFDMDAIRQQILAAETEEALAAIEIPIIPRDII